MTTQTEMQAKVQRWEEDVDRQELFVNGRSDQTVVLRDGRTLRTMAKMDAEAGVQIDGATAAATLSRNWAEGTGQPGGAGTKSSKAWSLSAADQAAIAIARALVALQASNDSGAYLNAVKALIGNGPVAGTITIQATSRAVMAAIQNPTAGTQVMLSEAGREGLFRWVTINLQAKVAADPLQGIYVAPASDASGASGAWVRAVVSPTKPGWWGAKGDGATNDTEALYAMSAWVTATGGGIVEMDCLVYAVGGLANQKFVAAPDLYAYGPIRPYIMLFNNCARGVVIRGNGAVLRNIAGARYGTFNDDGTKKNVPNGYYGRGASTPYFTMIEIAGCASVDFSGFELDGNLFNTTIGGPFSDTGIQLQMTGFGVHGTPGAVRIANIYTHHQGCDGYWLSGRCQNDNDPTENATVSAVKAEFNGRDALSFTEGKGWLFLNCSFNYCGRATANSTALGPVASNPCSGIDFEAETGKIRNIHMIECEFVNNTNQCVVSDGTDVEGLFFDNPRFIATSNYATWMRPKRIRINGGITVGTNVFLSLSSTNWENGVIYRNHFFALDPAYSPTGTVGNTNFLFSESAGSYGKYYDCYFRFNMGKNNYSYIGSYFGICEDCTFEAVSGGFRPAGNLFRGKTRFIETGGGNAQVIAIPYPGSAPPFFRFDAGDAADPWTLVTAGVSTTYPATLDPTTGVRSLTWLAGFSEGQTYTTTAWMNMLCNIYGVAINAATVVLPPSPVDRQIFRFQTDTAIAALTFQGGTGNATVSNGPAALAAGTGAAFKYVSESNRWVRF